MTVIFGITLFGCSSPVSKNETASTTPQNSSPAQTNSAANQNSERATTNTNYTTSNICAAPKQVAADKPFAALGGGIWGEWSKGGGYLGYGCKDAKNLSNAVHIKTEDADMSIDVKYDALGQAQFVHIVSTEYSASQTPILKPVEKKYREQFADFCDKLSSNFFGLNLPDTFKKKLLDEINYSPYLSDAKYGEKVGTGYVMMTSEISKEKDLIRLKIFFYSSETDYNKYSKS